MAANFSHSLVKLRSAAAETLAALCLLVLRWTKHLIVSAKYLTSCSLLSHCVFILFWSQPWWITELFTDFQKCTVCFNHEQNLCLFITRKLWHYAKPQMTHLTSSRHSKYIIMHNYVVVSPVCGPVFIA